MPDPQPLTVNPEPAQVEKLKKTKEKLGNYIKSDKFRERYSNFLNNLDGWNTFLSEEKEQEVLDKVQNKAFENFDNTIIKFDNEGKLSHTELGEFDPKTNEITLNYAMSYDWGHDERYNELEETLAHEAQHSIFDRGWLRSGLGLSGYKAREAGRGVFSKYDRDVSDELRDLYTKIREKQGQYENSDFANYAFQDAEIRSEVWATREKLDEIIININNKKFIESADSEEKRLEEEEIYNYLQENPLNSAWDGDFTDTHYHLLKRYDADRPNSPFKTGNRLMRMLGNEDKQTMTKLMNIIASNNLPKIKDINMT